MALIQSVLTSVIFSAKFRILFANCTVFIPDKNTLVGILSKMAFSITTLGIKIFSIMGLRQTFLLKVMLGVAFFIVMLVLHIQINALQTCNNHPWGGMSLESCCNQSQEI